MGQRIGFSEGDVMKMNAMYRCTAVAPAYASRGYRSAAAPPVPTQQYTYPHQQQYNYAYTNYQTHYGYTSNGYYYQG